MMSGHLRTNYPRGPVLPTGQTMNKIGRTLNALMPDEDRVIMAMRLRLIMAAKALRDEGVPPPGVDNPEAFGVRSAIINLPKEQNWVDASRDMVRAFTGSGAVNRV